MIDPIEHVIQELNRLDEQGILITERLLQEAREGVVSALASNITQYQRSALGAIMESINAALTRFQREYVTELHALQVKGWTLGTQLVDLPLADAGFRTTSLGPIVSSDLLKVLQGYSADLVTNMTDAARSKLTSEIRLGVLSGRSPAELIERIGTTIDKGVFATIKARAATIAQTETTRIAGTSSAERLLQAVKLVPDLKQQWDARHDRHTRPAHHLANGQIVKIGEPFEVGGEKLRYPGDPKGTPGNTINCRCKVVPYSAMWPDVITPAQQALARGEAA